MNPAQMNLNPMTQIDPVVIVGIMLIVVVTYVLLRRVFVLPYVRVMEERERLFESSDASLVEADGCRRGAKESAEQLVSDAADQAEKLRADALAEADEYRAKRMSSASAGATAVLEHGRDEIVADRTAELAHLREQACACVGLACDKLLGGADPVAVATAVDHALARHEG